MPATRKMYSFYITTPLLKGLRDIKRREGISESEQIRRAIEAWLELNTQKEAKRGSTRKR